MATVGEKIKSLRKELKLTQTDLAGEELTKSMLSQIENNQSNPSLKTLRYFAGRLNRPVSYFLEDQPEHENNILDSGTDNELDMQISRINDLIEAGHLTEAQNEIQSRLSEKHQNSTSKSFADIILKLGIALLKDNKLEEAQKYLNHSIQIYIKEAFFLEAAKAYVELAKTYYLKFDYSECLIILDKITALYNKSFSKDPFFEIELCYHKLIVLSALGDLKQTSEIIQAAFALSEKTAVYYKMDEFYRLNALFHILMNNKEDYEQSIEKALQFAELTNDNVCLANIYALKGFVALANDSEDIRTSAQEALEYAEKMKYYYGGEIHIYHFINSRAYYLLENYEQAYKSIKKMNYPTYVTHKFDYINMWSAKIYEGLILNKLGKNPEAVDAIKLGIEKMSVVGDSKLLVFANKSISEIYSSMNDYQNAFLHLKIANEIQERINRDGNIIF